MSEGSKGPERSRRRGVIASRRRLDRAMSQAGFRTQVALAERMAEREGLDSPPTYLVSRVFREQPVDPTSLERVAATLGVESHTLYRTSSEEVQEEEEDAVPSAGSGAPDGTPTPSPPMPPPSSPSPRRFWSVPLILLALILGISIVFGLRNPPESTFTDGGESPVPVETPVRTLALLQPSEGGEEAETIYSVVYAALESIEPRLFSPLASRTLSFTHPQEAREKLGVEEVISIQWLEEGRHRGLLLHLHDARGKRLLWSGAWPATSPARLADRLEKELLRNLRLLRAGKERVASLYPGEAALRHFLAGRNHQSRANTELNIKRAISRFEAALLASPDFAQARAGVCLAFLDQYKRGEDLETLSSARRACAVARKLAPDAPLVRGANALALMYAGESQRALQEIEEALTLHPDDTDLLRWASEILLSRYTATGDERFAEKALSHAQRATEIEPGYWKTWLVLGRVHYYSGNPRKAREATARGAELDRNPILLTNLGSIEFCLGDFSAARNHFEEVRRIAPDSYIGDSFMGSVYYMLRDYEKAEQIWSSAMRKLAEDGDVEDHAGWSTLAQIHTFLGRRELAREEIRKAIRRAEADLASEIGMAETAAYLATYYLLLYELDSPGGPTPAEAATIRELIRKGESVPSPHGQARLAEAHMKLGEMEEAVRHYRAGTATCPGFGGHPPLDPIRAWIAERETGGDATPGPPETALR